MNLPNKLTVARVVAVPVFILLYEMAYFRTAFLVFVAASMTDWLDGRIARKYKLITNFGKIMDPLADKVLVYAAFCLFVADQIMPAWMLIVILAREFIVAGIRTVAASEGIVIAAAMSGKLKTVIQMLTVLFFLITASLQGASLYGAFRILSLLLLWLALALTVYSGGEYIGKNIKVFRL